MTTMYKPPSSISIAVIGLGYVGLPLAIEFGKLFPTIGYDISQQRIAQLREHIDTTLESKADELRAATQLRYATEVDELRTANVYIVTVPTPIDDHKRPDLTPLLSAAETVGKLIKPGDVAVFESTVYPGATEELCVPVIERESGLRCNEDFAVGYSPERINPGDRERRLATIIKVTSGSTPEAAAFIDDLYARIVPAGTHKASSIRVAEAAKVIENTQRDLNIALMNELALIFNRMGIDTEEVLVAAGTKWNFLPFRPGLVGGHCIGVDPYYLTYKAETLGYHPQVILSGRKINDGMGKFVAEQTIKRMILRGFCVNKETVIVMGLTFKEDVPDTRNSRVIDVVRELESFGAKVLVHDPIADPREAEHEYGIRLTKWDELPQSAAIVAAVAHREFKNRPLEQVLAKLAPNGVYMDVKNQADARALRARGIDVWRL
jgi:UDP-N-acetyl-D-glucosamine/UDP-N-acetyl-D-galactosamine dehydrogenase